MANDRATAAPAAIRKNPSGNGRSYRWASAWADASSATVAHANNAAARRAAEHLIRLPRMHFKIDQHRVAPSLAMGLNRKAAARVRTKGHSPRRVGVDRGLEVVAVQMKKSAGSTVQLISTASPRRTWITLRSFTSRLFSTRKSKRRVSSLLIWPLEATIFEKKATTALAKIVNRNGCLPDLLR